MTSSCDFFGVSIAADVASVGHHTGFSTGGCLGFHTYVVMLAGSGSVTALTLAGLNAVCPFAAEIVTQNLYYGLRNDNFVTDGAVRTLGLTGGFTARCNCCIGDHVCVVLVTCSCVTAGVHASTVFATEIMFQGSDSAVACQPCGQIFDLGLACLVTEIALTNRAVPVSFVTYYAACGSRCFGHGLAVAVCLINNAAKLGCAVLVSKVLVTDRAVIVCNCAVLGTVRGLCCMVSHVMIGNLFVTVLTIADMIFVLILVTQLIDLIGLSCATDGAGVSTLTLCRTSSCSNSFRQIPGVLAGILIISRNLAVSHSLLVGTICSICTQLCNMSIDILAVYNLVARASCFIRTLVFV